MFTNATVLTLVTYKLQWAVMTSYNLVNGTHADMNEYLIQKILRGQWGWKG